MASWIRILWRDVEVFRFDGGGDTFWFRLWGKKFDKTLKRVENLLLMIDDSVEVGGHWI